MGGLPPRAGLKPLQKAMGRNPIAGHTMFHVKHNKNNNKKNQNNFGNSKNIHNFTISNNKTKKEVNHQSNDL